MFYITNRHSKYGLISRNMKPLSGVVYESVIIRLSVVPGILSSSIIPLLIAKVSLTQYN